MRKTLSIIISVCLILSLCACGNNTNNNEAVGMPNPIKECASLQEINDALGCKLTHPGVMGVTDEKFLLYETSEYTMAEYKFSVNGYEYSFRCAPIAYMDISGYYINGKLAFNEETSNYVEFSGDGNAKLSRWFTLDGQYVLCVKDKGQMQQDTFENITNELMEMTFTWLTPSEISELFKGMAGNYQDTYSQRATMTVTDKGGYAQMNVHWANSSDEYYEWNMTCHISEDGLIYYNDGSLKEVKGTNETIKYTDAYGYFSYSGTELYWIGAVDSDCRECCFIKI